MSASQLYWRKFLRGDPALFRDTPADSVFATDNFKDFFGKDWLPAHPTAFSFDSVSADASLIENSSTFFQIFAVSDGSLIQSTPENLDWLNQSIRFIAIVAGNSNNKPSKPFESAWTLCIVGSSQLMSQEAFLQVASWDGNRFRYYGREHVNNEEGTPLAWIFMGDSTEAFGEQAYMGPFNGHVNGSLVMKELHRPWMHWLAGGNNFTNHVSNLRLKQFDNVPYLSNTDTATDIAKVETDSLAKVSGADALEKYMISGINRWFASRRLMDFIDDKTKKPLEEVKNVKRWLAHLLLTTTVNMTAARRDTSGDSSQNDFTFPPEHFYNEDLFGSTLATGIQPSSGLKELGFSDTAYGHALDAVKLAIVQRYPPPGRPQPDPVQHPEAGNLSIGGTEPGELGPRAFVVQFGEGENLRFQILQPSYEDFQGALTLLDMTRRKPPLLSKEFIFALLMVDPWNPIYSWKRGVLLQYAPETSRLPGPFDPNADPPQKYDLEAVMEAAVRDSPRFNQDRDSPERDFIANLEIQRTGAAGSSSTIFSDRMTNYLTAIHERLRNPATVNEAMSDYMKLAESRRRIYRPIPLDEFDLTLPWATEWNHTVPLEMTSAGTIASIAPRGVKFFADWIASLANIKDPHLIPRPDKDEAPSSLGNDASSVTTMSLSIAKGIAANLSCKPSADHVHYRSGSCPMRMEPILRRDSTSRI